MIASRSGSWPLPGSLRAALDALGVELDPIDRIAPDDLSPAVCLKCQRAIWVWHAARPALPFEIWDRRDGQSFLRLHPCWLEHAQQGPWKAPGHARAGPG